MPARHGSNFGSRASGHSTPAQSRVRMRLRIVVPDTVARRSRAPCPSSSISSTRTKWSPGRMFGNDVTSSPVHSARRAISSSCAHAALGQVVEECGADFYELETTRSEVGRQVPSGCLAVRIRTRRAAQRRGSPLGRSPTAARSLVVGINSARVRRRVRFAGVRMSYPPLVLKHETVFIDVTM